MAPQRYEFARQKPTQSVKDCVNYVQSIEPELDQLVTEQMRFDRLWEGIFGIVLDAAAPRNGASYEAYVDPLNAAEQRISTRMKFLNSRHKRWRNG